MTILDDRLAQLDAITLAHGSHDKREQGMSAMEAAAWLAGEAHTDHPECVSKVLADFMIGLNDAWDEEHRQVLKSYLPKLIGTNDGHDQERGLLAADWLIRIYEPAWLRLAGLDDAPTVGELRQSALTLLDRMCEVGRR